MQAAQIFYDTLEVSLATGPDIQDITSDLSQLVRQSQIAYGVLFANAVGSTGSLTTIEFEPGVVADLKDAMDRWAPKGINYAHELAWHDGNGHSHLQAALMGPSINVAIRNKRLCLGTWQQVVAINHDNRARKRPIEVTIVGTMG